jgi:hypothetical protein
MDTMTKASPSEGTNTMANASHSEGSVAKAIENQTAKLPSDLFLWAAFGSMAGSLALQMMGKKEQSNFGAVGSDPVNPGPVQQAREGGRFRLMVPSR